MTAGMTLHVIYGIACAAGAQTACAKVRTIGQRPVVSTDAGT